VIHNLEEARFECVFPKCGGPCCHESRPNVTPGEVRRIEKALCRALERMRPAARRVVERAGWLTKRIKAGLPTIAVSERQCVFYKDGCVLHAIGAEEGDSTKYKPSTCILFPIDATKNGGWEVRQWGRKGETWKLFCLDPGASEKKAKETLATEVEFLARLESGRERWRD
jgi:hypothetical protein